MVRYNPCEVEETRFSGDNALAWVMRVPNHVSDIIGSLHDDPSVLGMGTVRGKEKGDQVVS